jgi:hypothetical protein
VESVDLRKGVLLLGVGVAAGALSAGCSNDIFDVQVDLQSQVYRADFGAPAGDIPTVACDPAVPQACGAGTTVAVDVMPGGVPGEVMVALGCDGATTRCFAQAEARLAMAVNVLQDEDFVTKVERRAIGLVRVVDVGYTVPANTLTFEVPQVDIYAGPEGSRRETDPGVAIVGSTAPIPAGATFSAEQHVTITDDTPAQPVIEDAIRNQRTFVFIVVLAPRLESGSPVPAGAIEINVSPRLLIGFPR